MRRILWSSLKVIHSSAHLSQSLEISLFCNQQAFKLLSLWAKSHWLSSVTFPEAWEVNPYFLALLLLQANFGHDSGKKKIPSSHYAPFVPLHALPTPPWASPMWRVSLALSLKKASWLGPSLQEQEGTWSTESQIWGQHPRKTDPKVTALGEIILRWILTEIGQKPQLDEFCFQVCFLKVDVVHGTNIFSISHCYSLGATLIHLL